MPSIAIVAPVFNEEQNIPELHRRLKAALPPSFPHTVSFLYINDGSTDSTLGILHDLQATDERIVIIDLARNFGHQPAVMAGIEVALEKHDLLVLMDSDLQDLPEAVPNLIEKQQQGYDVVYAVRTKRQESLFHRFAFRAFYRLLAAVSPLKIPMDSGLFCVMSSRVARVILEMPERNRFIPGLRAYAGFRQAGLPVARGERFAGEAKVGLRRQIQLAFDAIVSFSTIPLKLLTIFGFTVAASAFLVGFTGLVAKYVFSTQLLGWPFGLTTLLFVAGIQLISTGILGEYLGRIYDEVKKRPYYIISSVHEKAPR